MSGSQTGYAVAVEELCDPFTPLKRFCEDHDMSFIDYQINYWVKEGRD